MGDDKQKTGLIAEFETAAFSAGLKVYNSGLAVAESTSKKTAGAITAAFATMKQTVSGTLSTVGKIGAGGLGLLGIGGIVGVGAAIPTAIGVLQQYHDRINEVNSALHVGVQRSAEYVFAAREMGLDIGAISSAFATLESTMREATYEQQDLARQMQLSVRDNTYQMKIAQRDFSENLQQLDLQVTRSAEDRNLAIQRSLYDYQVSLARFDRDSMESLRGVHGRARRLAIIHIQEQRSDMVLAQQRQEQDRQIAYQREQQDTARQYMLLRRGFEEQAFLMKQAFDDMLKQLAISASRNPVLIALNNLGLKMSDVQKGMMLDEAGLARVGDAFRRLPNDAARAQAALALFGTSDQKFIDYIMNLRQSLANQKELLATFGVVFDQRKMDEYNQSVGRLQNIFDVVGIVVGQSVTPAIRDFNIGLTNMLKQVLPQAIGLLGDLAAAFKTRGLQGVIDVLKAWVEAHKAQIADLMQKISDVLVWAWGQITSGAKFIANTIGALIDQFAAWSQTTEGKAAITNFTTNLGNAIGQALNLFIKTTEWIATIMANFCLRLYNWMVSDSGKAWLGSIAGAFVSGLASGIGNAMKNVDWGALLMSTIGPDMLSLLRIATNQPYTFQDILPGGNLSNLLQLLNPPSGNPSQNLINNQHRIGGYASGGWVPTDMLAQLHAGEFVLNRQMVAQFAPILGSAGPTYNIDMSGWAWNGPASSFDKASIRDFVRGEAVAVVRQMIPRS